jgi:hypothetical protein
MIDEPTAKALVETHIGRMAEPGWCYVIQSTKRHEDCWAVAVQPYNADGEPAYNLLGFEVDAASGAITQWM